jgi:hypothetical protein
VSISAGLLPWEPSLARLHSPAWWRRHGARSGILDVEVADTMPDGWHRWLDWQHVASPDNTAEPRRVRRLWGCPGQPQTVTAARELESLVAASPGHDIVAGDLDGDCASDSLQFWTGRHVIDDTSVCYRSAWEAMHLAEPLATYLPENRHQMDVDWPIRGIDHVLVRCGPSDLALTIGGCRRVFDQRQRTPSDRYGLVVDLASPTRPV